MDWSDDLFKTEPKEPYKMSQKEFAEKSKAVLEKIYNSYSQSWKSRLLTDDERPEESVCDKCTGCGLFTKDGEIEPCVQDREQGECYHRFFDYEEAGIELETHLSDVYDLLSVEEVVNELP